MAIATVPVAIRMAQMPPVTALAHPPHLLSCGVNVKVRAKVARSSVTQKMLRGTKLAVRLFSAMSAELGSATLF